MSNWKYEISVINLERGIKIDEELRRKMEKLRHGLGKKRIAKMKKEAVECPVLKQRVSFLQCFFCPNFLRRVRGVVYCKGKQLRE